jgi:hypothetical protein
MVWYPGIFKNHFCFEFLYNSFKNIRG